MFSVEVGSREIVTHKWNLDPSYCACVMRFRKDSFTWLRASLSDGQGSSPTKGCMQMGRITLCSDERSRDSTTVCLGNSNTIASSGNSNPLLCLAIRTENVNRDDELEVMLR